ncbi:MAG: hypothetical protein ACLR8Y_03325 [Alistipes indistinctus]
MEVDAPVSIKNSPFGRLWWQSDGGNTVEDDLARLGLVELTGGKNHGYKGKKKIK